MPTPKAPLISGSFNKFHLLRFYEMEAVMTNWERREADILADAIGKHRRKHPHQVDDNELLAVIEKAVDECSHTIATTTDDLRRYRELVCAICRGSKLYECDVAEGWSQNCAFVTANTTLFGDL
jgi:hypothetical protein